MTETTHTPFGKLAAGFLNFQAETHAAKKKFFQDLAVKQQPKIMMIACCDSRVDPAILSNADPGDLFVVRNVANLVPPCLMDDAKHGTSAALEFAVTSLEVEHIIVLGHVRCGGIQALLTADPTIAEDHGFIHNWMQVADEARRRTLIVARNQPMDVQRRICEQEAIKTSLANLLTFPWIRERIDKGSLRIHGWHFDIAEGGMDVYVPERDRFEPLSMELAERLGQA